MTTRKPVVLSAGGTGGHLFPAEALAAELIRRGHAVVIFTDKRGVAFKSLGDSADIRTIRAATLKAGILPKIRAVWDMGIGILDAARQLRRLKPAVVVGFGGYPSFPGVFAAQILRLPTVLHEQNAVLGKANVVLAPCARRIALSAENTGGIRPRDRQKTAVTGNPVRAHIIDVRDQPYPAVEDDIRILITGGSQAATVFGDVVPAAMTKLPATLRQRLDIAHQAPAATVDTVRAAYAQAGVRAEVAPFFADMGARLARCHLFIGRAGASTVTEIAVAGRPAIFVPYPGHKDMQQKHNAETVTGRGGGWLMLQPDFTPAALAERLDALAEDTAQLAAAAAAAKSCGRPDATRQLADLVETVASPA